MFAFNGKVVMRNGVENDGEQGCEKGLGGKEGGEAAIRMQSKIINNNNNYKNTKVGIYTGRQLMLTSDLYRHTLRWFSQSYIQKTHNKIIHHKIMKINQEGISMWLPYGMVYFPILFLHFKDETQTRSILIYFSMTSGLKKMSSSLSLQQYN